MAVEATGTTASNEKQAITVENSLCETFQDSRADQTAVFLNSDRRLLLNFRLLLSVIGEIQIMDPI